VEPVGGVFGLLFFDFGEAARLRARPCVVCARRCGVLGLLVRGRLCDIDYRIFFFRRPGVPRAPRRRCLDPLWPPRGRRGGGSAARGRPRTSARQPLFCSWQRVPLVLVFSSADAPASLAGCRRDGCLLQPPRVSLEVGAPAPAPLSLTQSGYDCKSINRKPSSHRPRTVVLQCCPPSMAIVRPESSPYFSCRRR